MQQALSFVSSHPLSLLPLFLFCSSFFKLLNSPFLPPPPPRPPTPWLFSPYVHILIISHVFSLLSLPSHLFPFLQRCRCPRCFVSPRSESYRFRSGNSTRRVSSWSPSTLLSIPAARVTHTSSASCTGPCWSERRRGTQMKHTPVFSLSVPPFIE